MKRNKLNVMILRDCQSMRPQEKDDWEKGDVAEVGCHLNTPKPSTPLCQPGSDLTPREGSLKQQPQLFGLQETRRLLFLMNPQTLACLGSQPFKNVFYCDTVVTLPNANAGKQNPERGPTKSLTRSVSKHCASRASLCGQNRPSLFSWW